MLNDRAFGKVIYSRILALNCIKKASDVFLMLNSLYKNTFNYIISIPDVGTWIGATPEKLGTIEGTNFETTSIAGTRTKEETWGKKEIEEQLIVTDFIEMILHQNKCKNIQKKGPITFDTGVVSHIKTDFQAQINFEDWQQIIDDLHPTPATCGLPQKESLAFIEDYEQH